MPEQEINLRFVSIEIVSKLLSIPPVMPPGGTLSFNFSYLVDIRVDEGRKAAIVMCDITINELDNQAKLAFFKTICLFEFPEFDAHFTKREDNNFDIPVDLEIMLKSVSISTARGVVFSELRGTYLHGAILPLIDIATPVKLAHEQRAKISLEG